MPFSGLIAVLDDVAAIADDVATLAVAATKKTSGIVTDDMAVTAEQTLGLSRERELPVVLAVALGSLRNKALFLAPGALLLNAIAPWSITPLLMAGGSYLAFEGVEKILHKFQRHNDPHTSDPHDGIENAEEPLDPVAFEKVRVAGAIRTDLILSGEIVAITLGEIGEAIFVTQAAVLYGVSLFMTLGVYGTVAVLVKIDDAGEFLSKRGGPLALLGKGILRMAPWLLHAIAWIGTIAMLTVGGHILLEGIHPLAVHVHHLLSDFMPLWAQLLGMLIDIAIGGVAGLAMVGVMATGIPGRLVSLFAKQQRA